MVMELDTTKLSQAGSRKLTPHDNCTVLDLGTGSFPRLIELRLPGFDGARQSALWDGSLDLEVNDLVIADEYAGQSIWRISSMGGGDSGAGKVRVNKIWAEDFTSVSLQTDATDNVTINTGTLTLPSDIIHLGDTDTKISFTDDDIEAVVGSLSMLKLTEAAQDLINLGPGSGDIDINFNGDMFLQGSSGRVGIGTALPNASLQIGNVSLGILAGFGMILSDSTANSQFRIGQSTTGRLVIRWNFNAVVASASASIFIPEDQDLFIQQSGGNVQIGSTLPSSAKLHVDQFDTVAAQPVLYLDQADLSEEMVEFNTTIGTGNPIEVSALKLLTTTHFIKVTVPGGLTRYMPVGTISTTGPILYKSQTVTTQGLGANPDIYAFGFYEFSATDANLTQASTTQTFGTANISYAAHTFVVAGGVGSVDTGVIGLRVNGTSINDQGTRSTGDTETIIADITAVATDEYQESNKKWLGQVTFELFTVSGSPTTFSLDFNYGFAKYDDWGNTDFTLTDIETIGFAGANDTNFDIKLIHHQSSGWTYAATGFTPITAANTIASLVSDHSTDDQLLSSQHMAWKRDNLSTAINGNDSEGFMVFISSSANNAIEYLNLHVGVVF